MNETTRLLNGEAVPMQRPVVGENGAVRCPYCATRYPVGFILTDGRRIPYVTALLEGEAAHVCIGCHGEWLPLEWIDTVEVYCPGCGHAVPGRTWFTHAAHHNNVCQQQQVIREAERIVSGGR